MSILKIRLQWCLHQPTHSYTVTCHSSLLADEHCSWSSMPITPASYLSESAIDKPSKRVAVLVHIQRSLLMLVTAYSVCCDNERRSACLKVVFFLINLMVSLTVALWMRRFAIAPSLVPKTWILGWCVFKLMNCHENLFQQLGCSVFFRPKYRFVHPKTIDFHYLKKYFMDQSIRKTFYFIMKTDALLGCRDEDLDGVESEEVQERKERRLMRSRQMAAMNHKHRYESFFFSRHIG